MPKKNVIKNSPHNSQPNPKETKKIARKIVSSTKIISNI
jgi:hypothetical protein